VNAAVVEKAGPLDLYLSSEAAESNNLYGLGENSVEVATVVLDDDLLARDIRDVDLLKIDVEGAEPQVLKGAARLLKCQRPPTIIIEVNPASLRSAKSSPSAVLEFLKSSGYRCTELERFIYQGEIVVNMLATPKFPLQR
jgi:hypothetical protein